MTTAAARLRAQGATEALASAGLTLAGGEPLYGEWTEEWGRQAADMLLRSAPELDAVFCGLPHGTTQEIIAAVLKANPDIRILDMSADFRLRDKATSQIIGAASFTAQDDRVTASPDGAINNVAKRIRAYVGDAYVR